MKIIKFNIPFKVLLCFCVLFGTAACSLDEFNPHGSTIDKVASTPEGYNKIINACYFDLQRSFYGREFLNVTEAGTDIWTSCYNSSSYQNYFKYAAGAAMPIDMAKDWWNGSYDAINNCNIAIDRLNQVQGLSEDDKNAKVAEAHFLRALHYYHLVEQFGPCVLNVHETTTPETNAYRTNPLEVYTKVIIPDLEFAAQYLPKVRAVSDYGRPVKKSALGFLAKACLQTKEYGSGDYIAEALSTAKKLIDDVTAGGATYDAHLYSNFAYNFDVARNKYSDEALYAVAYSQSYGSTNVYSHNNDYQKFVCSPIVIAAIEKKNHELEVGRWSDGTFMPTRYLLDLFVMPDGKLDPRYALSFQTFWTSNVKYTWTADDLKRFDRSPMVTNATVISVGDSAIRFCRSEEADYASNVSGKLSKKYIWVDMNDVYSSNNSVLMTYNRVNIEPGTVENPFYKIYPSLTKYNNGSLVSPKTGKYTSDATAVAMRMGEIYLIAAEAEFYLNGATQASADYINVLRDRVKCNRASSSDISIQFILDERARELCGEYSRWYDLKRTGKLTHTYLNEKNPDVGQYFLDGVHDNRPIPQGQIDAISNPSGFQNPGY